MHPSYPDLPRDHLSNSLLVSQPCLFFLNFRDFAHLASTNKRFHEFHENMWAWMKENYLKLNLCALIPKDDQWKWNVRHYESDELLDFALKYKIRNLLSIVNVINASSVNDYLFFFVDTNDKRQRTHGHFRLLLEIKDASFMDLRIAFASTTLLIHAIEVKATDEVVDILNFLNELVQRQTFNIQSHIATKVETYINSIDNNGKSAFDYINEGLAIHKHSPHWTRWYIEIKDMLVNISSPMRRRRWMLSSCPLRIAFLWLWCLRQTWKLLYSIYNFLTCRVCCRQEDQLQWRPGFLLSCDAFIHCCCLSEPDCGQCFQCCGEICCYRCCSKIE